MSETKTTPSQLGKDAADRVREQVSTIEIGQRAKDAAYTLVGLGVLGAQKATAATKQATRQLGGERSTATIDLAALRARSKDATTQALRQLSKADDVLAGALARIEEAFAPLEERLPDAARDAVQRLRDAGHELHAQMRARVSTEAGADSDAGSEDHKPKARRSSTAA